MGRQNPCPSNYRKYSSKYLGHPLQVTSHLIAIVFRIPYLIGQEITGLTTNTQRQTQIRTMPLAASFSVMLAGYW